VFGKVMLSVRPFRPRWSQAGAARRKGGRPKHPWKDRGESLDLNQEEAARQTFGKRKKETIGSCRIRDGRIGFSRLARCFRSAPLFGIVGPGAAHHAEQPAFDTAFTFPVMALVDCPAAHQPHQIIRLRRAARQRQRKAAQSRQEGDQIASDVGC
jgi:hypothetical protein